MAGGRVNYNLTNRFPYIYRGEVLDNEDSTNLGKCKIRVFGVHGKIDNKDVLPWARPVVLSPVNDKKGSINIPDVGDIVWVLFEGGDKEYPVYFGGTYGDSDIEVDKNITCIYVDDSNKIIYDKSKKSYIINSGSNGIVINDDHVTIIGNLQIKGDIQIEGNIEMTGEIDTGVSLIIEEVIEGEPNSDDPDISDDPSPAPPPGEISDKALYVTGDVGINRLSDSEAFCSSLVTTISVDCRDENGNTYTKKLTVNKYLADDIKQIFKEIYENTTFCIRNGDTGAYCYRKVSGKDKLSYHSYGVAIDLNWNDNPYDKSKSAGGVDDNIRLRTTNHEVVQIFYNHDWGWGGTYGDYMHFSYFNGW